MLGAAERRTRWIVLAIVLLAAALRLVNANADYWFDEIRTIHLFVDAPLSTVVTQYGLANNHVMNSVLANVAHSLLGAEPWAVRLPAILFGVAGVWAFWRVASALWTRTSALLGTALFAVSWHHVHYSQNARGYSALIFFALLATGFLLRMPRTRDEAPRSRDGIGYALAIGLGLYAMLLMGFVALGHAAVLVATRRWRALGWLGAGVGLALVLYAPMLRSLVEYHLSHPEDTGHPILSAAFAQMIAPSAVLLAAAAAGGLLVATRFARRDPVAAALVLAPLALTVLLPLVRGQGVYPRTFMLALPVAYLLLTEALDWADSARPWASPAIAAAVAGASLAALLPYYQLPKQGFRQAVLYVNARRGEGDLRLGFTLAGKAARFYDETITLIETEPQLRQALAGRRRAWVVSTFPTAMRENEPELAAWLESNTVPEVAFPGVVGDGTVRVHRWEPAR